MRMSCSRIAVEPLALVATKVLSEIKANERRGFSFREKFEFGDHLYDNNRAAFQRSWESAVSNRTADVPYFFNNQKRYHEDYDTRHHLMNSSLGPGANYCVPYTKSQ